MADYSWVSIKIKSDDPETLSEAEEYFDSPEVAWRDAGWSCFEGERSYGMVDELEAFLIEKGIEYHRYSDGKYEYDGDEAHWIPGMDERRVFTRLNNGGRVFTEGEFSANADKTNEELGAIVREQFEFPIEEVTHTT